MSSNVIFCPTNKNKILILIWNGEKQESSDISEAVTRKCNILKALPDTRPINGPGQHISHYQLVVDISVSINLPADKILQYRNTKLGWSF